jgi:uncharacterized NAD-dependent epimerase/dehydratase family protein
MARRLNPDVRCAGISINCAGMSSVERHRHLAEVSVELGMLSFDPVATGTESLIAHIQKTFN